MKITDTFGITPAEYETIKSEAERIAALGYKVPNITVKWLGRFVYVQGLAGGDTIYIHPNGNLDELRFTVAHEIGHHNEPQREYNIWTLPTIEQSIQASEDFANWFANNI